MFLKNKQGFTLIELLVVIAIIGLLANMVVVSLNKARQKSRDAKRLHTIKQIQTALELYFADHDGYAGGSSLSIGTASFDSLDNGGWGSQCDNTPCYMDNISGDPDPDGVYTYTYSSVDNDSDGYNESYTLDFGLEAKAGSLECSTYQNGCCQATPSGISCN